MTTTDKLIVTEHQTELKSPANEYFELRQKAQKLDELHRTLSDFSYLDQMADNRSE